ncbi:MAG: uncharacterized protein KVP18_002010 [Porospora cf. gigantea A]|uniref:uncharacterized protein n=1 Tax=Porospora cf. gigantea A TaxID=2853593 RepID=UPI00355A9F4F|nr:MAG: hypothetical protein KVP18_002010 [Porospora cf. gigantea A]
MTLPVHDVSLSSTGLRLKREGHLKPPTRIEPKRPNRALTRPSEQILTWYAQLASRTEVDDITISRLPSLLVECGLESKDARKVTIQTQTACLTFERKL